MANHKRHRAMDNVDSMHDAKFPRLRQLADDCPSPDIIVEGADFVDYEDDDIETGPPQTSQGTYSESVVNMWCDFNVLRLKCCRAVLGLSTHVLNVVAHFFDTQSFEPMPGLFWSDLFSRDVASIEVMNPETSEMFHEYHNSTPATVPLFDWSRSLPHPKFANFPLSQLCLDDLSAFQVFLLSAILPELGFETSALQNTWNEHAMSDCGGRLVPSDPH
jgi:hypothetical protein